MTASLKLSEVRIQRACSSPGLKARVPVGHRAISLAQGHETGSLLLLSYSAFFSFFASQTATGTIVSALIGLCPSFGTI